MAFPSNLFAGNLTSTTEALRELCEQHERGYVFGVPCSFGLTLTSGRRVRADQALKLVPPKAWNLASCGAGSKGERTYWWAWIATTSQLRSLGLTWDDIAYRARTGRLHPIHRGVYAVGHRHLTETGLFVAAVLAVGPGAVLSHASAAALWEIAQRGQRWVDVTVGRRVKSRRGIRIHAVRTLPPADVTHHHGIPVTTPARTLLDFADVAPGRSFERAVHEAEVRDTVSERRAAGVGPAVDAFVEEGP